jgi:hypothetical protein
MFGYRRTKLFLHILSDLEGFKNLQGLGIESSLNTLEISK